MRITVNELIQNCAQRVNIVGNGQSADGQIVRKAIEDLNTAVDELNLDEYLSFNYKNFDVEAAIVDNEPIIRIGDSDGYEIRLDDAPLTIKGVARKVGVQWVPLTVVNRAALDNHRSLGLPQCYNVDSHFDKSAGCVCTVIALNGSGRIPIRVTLLETMPEYKVNDEINLPKTYISLIMAALCVKTCARYKLEYIQQYRDELDSLKEQISRVNNSNRPLVIDASGCNDSFFNVFAPEQWA